MLLLLQIFTFLLHLNVFLNDNAFHNGQIMYKVCPKSKCTDFPTDELVMQHLVYVYLRVGLTLAGRRNRF